jgi:spore maturation protein CgeB
MLSSMQKHKYAICSIGPNQAITHRGLTTHQKMDLISRSKISLASNQLYLTKQQIEYCKHHYPNYKDNRAFLYLDTGTVPQFKSRVMEAAFCKSLNLVKYDYWNVIEEWFKPDEDFVYYYNNVDLSEKIEHILANYNDYIPLINSAYKKVLSYDIDDQMRRIINKQKMYNE